MIKTDKSNLINTNSPRDSQVFADGDYVVKKPVATNNAQIKVWLDRQKHARDVVDKMPKNKAYFIPRIVEISEQPNAFIREERVMGEPLTAEKFSGLSAQQKETIYTALAQFVSDMNQSEPVFDITNQLQFKHNNDLSLFDTLKSLKSVLNDKEIKVINDTFELLKKNINGTPSFVFFHGDMNENNIFFDKKTNTVSIIDFTEARYESAYYMFNSDLSRLSWLNIEKLVEIYNKIPKKNDVRTGQNKNIIDLFNALRNIQTTGNSLLNKPQNIQIYKMMLKEAVANMEKAYQRVVLVNAPGYSR